jgi:hypothetical protein
VRRTIESIALEDAMARNLCVTTTLPPPGREEAVLRVAARLKPDVLRIVVRLPMPDLRQPFDLDRLEQRRDQARMRIAEADAVAHRIVGSGTRVETGESGRPVDTRVPA